MKDKLTVVGIIEADTEKTEFVKEEAIKLIDVTRDEEGCIKYDLHQDNEKPNVFLFYEIWENREMWQNHMEKDHIKSFLGTTEGMLRGFSAHEMTYVE